MILRRRMISDLSPGSTPRQTNGCLSMEAFGTVAPMEDFPHALGRDQPRDDRHMDLCPSLEDADRARYLPVLQAVDVHEAPSGGRKPPVVGMVVPFTTYIIVPDCHRCGFCMGSFRCVMGWHGVVADRCAT